MNPTSLQPCNSCIRTLIEELSSKKKIFEKLFSRYILYAQFKSCLSPFFLGLNVENQHANLTLNYYFDHNLNFKSPNEECKLIFHIYLQNLLDSLKITQFEQCFIFTLIPSTWSIRFKFSK